MPGCSSVRIRTLFVLFAVLLPASGLAEVAAAPRPISETERMAVETAAEFLSTGRPDAFWDRLAADAPLRKLGKDEALKEIMVRTGPHQDAIWELQTVVPSLKDRTAAFSISFPSGIDDTLIIDFVSEAGTPKIQNLRILVEPPPGASSASSTPAPTPSVVTASLQNPVSPLILFLGLLGAACAIAAASYIPPAPPIRIALRGQPPPPPVSTRKRMIPPTLVIAGIALITAGIMTAVFKDPRFGSVSTAGLVNKTDEEKGVDRLSQVLVLREMMANGSDSLEKYLENKPPAGLAGQATLLWKAQYAMQNEETEEADKILAAFPSPSNIPLAEILRARLGFYRSKEVDAVLGYERAISLGPGRDGLWYEAAQILDILGYETQARTYLTRLARIGSREPDVYYTLAMEAALKDNISDAEGLVRRAWQMRPMERSELIETELLWEVLRRDSVAALVKLNSAEEPRFSSAETATRSIKVPAGSASRVSGDFLHIEIGAQQLRVPGGASLAPQDTAVVDAGEWERTDEQRALLDYPELLRVADSAGAFSQPELGQRIEDTASALANHNRWPDVLQLTSAISPQAENIPTELFFLRGTALQKTRQLPEAKQLYADLAVSRGIQRKNDAHTLLMLGEMLHSVEMYDVAIKLMERAGRIRDIPYLEQRIAQVSMNQELATAYELHQTANFDVRYPREMTQPQAVIVGNILEAEFVRLGKLIPLKSFERVTVNIMPWDDFRNVYTGSDHILGFYNGKITLPFAGVPVFIPEVVAILSHELTHAMVAQATRDQAPRWFQEGIAQRLQMEKYTPNAFNMYDDDKLFSVAVLDAVMRGSPDPDMMQEAYIESQTLLRYIESRYGWAGVSKMILAYRDGATTDEAINQLWKQKVSEFDTQLRAWGRAESRVFENPEPIRYDRRWDDINIEFKKAVN